MKVELPYFLLLHLKIRGLPLISVTKRMMRNDQVDITMWSSFLHNFLMKRIVDEQMIIASWVGSHVMHIYGEKLRYSQ